MIVEEKTGMMSKSDLIWKVFCFLREKHPNQFENVLDDLFMLENINDALSGGLKRASDKHREKK